MTTHTYTTANVSHSLTNNIQTIIMHINILLFLSSPYLFLVCLDVQTARKVFPAWDSV